MIKIDFDVPIGLSLFFSNTHKAGKRESSFLFMPRGLECWLHVSYFIIRLQLVLGKKNTAKTRSVCNNKLRLLVLVLCFTNHKP